MGFGGGGRGGEAVLRDILTKGSGGRSHGIGVQAQVLLGSKTH